jgi:hypothetical protein
MAFAFCDFLRIYKNKIRVGWYVFTFLLMVKTIQVNIVLITT